MLQGIFMHSLIMHLTWLVKSTAAFLKPYLAALKTYQVILLYLGMPYETKLNFDKWTSNR